MNFFRCPQNKYNYKLNELKPANRRGMLIPMILIGMFIFIMFFFTLMRWNSSNRRMNYQDVWGRKALYLAKGGTQLALLKVSMMPTECYDALAISQLKNPYFSFKIAAERVAAGKKPVNPNPKEIDFNPGPQYLTGPGDNRDALLQDPAYVGTKEDPLSGELNVFIKAFTDDIKFAGPDTDPITGERTVPYKHGFASTKVKVLAVKGQQLYNKQTVELTVKGWVYDGMNIKREKEVTKIVEVERK